MATFKCVVLIISVPVVLCAFSSEYSTHTLSPGSCNDTHPCIDANSICHKEICVTKRCPSGYIIDSSETKCLKVAVQYDDSCQDNVQCTEFLGEGAVCQNDKCACRWGHYLHGRCHWPNKLGDLCAYDDECFDGSEYQATSCKNNVCECSEGFYQRGRTACRRRQKVGDECLLDWDCDFVNGTCVSHKCVQNGKQMEISGDETVRFTTKRAGGIKIGSTCKNNTDCQSIKNSICDVDGSCICERAHFPSEDKTGCVPEIGEKCDSSKPVLQVEHAVCRENMWTCPIDRIATKDNRECKELFDTIEEICQVDEECRLFGPNAECIKSNCRCVTSSIYKESKHFCWDESKDGSELGTHCKKNCDTKHSYCQDDKCACDKYFFEMDGLCAAGINAECQSDEDCKRDKSVCDKSTNTCKCELNLVPTPDDKCLPKSQYYETCEYDVQCTATLPNTLCKYVTEGPRCECLKKYFFMDGKCQQKKWLGDVCTKSEECFTSNTTCKDGHCECASTHVRNKDKCVLKIGTQCKNYEDCDMPNSLCQDKKCVCKSYYHDLDGLCAAGLHAKCEDNDNCKFKDMVCRETEGTCQCRPNYVNNSDVECLPKSRYNETCKHAVQCSSSLPHSTCTEGRCQCETQYPNYHDEKCNSSSTIISPLFSLVVLILLGLKVAL